MTPLQKVRIGLAVAAIVVWGYAYANDDARLRLAGIVLLAVSLLLRFVPQKRPDDDRPAT